MIELPSFVLSVRQPQPFFLLRLPIEYRSCVINRDEPLPDYRGEIWIRAGKKPTKKAFYAGLELAEQAFVPSEHMPALEKLEFGGIVGRARVVGVYRPGRQHDRWHDPKQYGYVIADAVAVPFVECPGERGLYGVPASVLEQLRRAAA